MNSVLQNFKRVDELKKALQDLNAGAAAGAVPNDPDTNLTVAG